MPTGRKPKNTMKATTKYKKDVRLSGEEARARNKSLVNRSSKPKTQNKISVVKPTKKARISGPTVKPKGTPTMRSKQHSALPGNTASAKVIRDVVNMLSRLPGGSDAANKNMRRSVNAAYNRTRAEQGAKAAGNSAASQRAVNRAKTRQVAPRRKKK